MIYAMSLNFGSKVATIKVEMAVSNARKNITALYALMGGYNQVARSVDVDEFHKLQDEFRSVVGKMAARM